MDRATSNIEISVVIPTHNRADIIAATIDSILAQTYPIKEIIVVDDGSTDETQSVLAQYGDNITSKTIENAGALVARKTAMEMSTSPWVAFCDDDDIWDHDHLARLAAMVQAYPDLDYGFSNFREFGPHARYENKLASLPDRWHRGLPKVDSDGFLYLGAHMFPKIVRWNPIFPSAAIVRRSFYNRIGGLRECFGRCLTEDSDFTRRAAAYGVLVCDTKITVAIRKHEKNISGNNLRRLKGRVKLLAMQLKDGSIPEKYHADIEQALSDAKVEYVMECFICREWDLFEAGYKELSSRERTWNLTARHALMSLPQTLRDMIITLTISLKSRRLF